MKNTKFTSINGEPHNLSVNDVITVSDDVTSDQVRVTSVINSLTFTAEI